MRLVLIRHAESEHSRRGMIAGVAGCTGLTERGLVQARTLADRLRATGELRDCAALLSSPVRRACQTAETLVGALPVERIELDCDLCELHPGAADGLSWDEYRVRYGAFDLPASPSRPFAPGAESWDDFAGRVRATLARLVERYAGQTIVAVSHAGFIVVSLLELLDIPRSGSRARLEPVHTGITEWCYTDGAWILTRYNDAAHLR